MDRRRRIRTSKLLSLVLRHAPGRIGLVLDPAGWAQIDELLAALPDLDRPGLDEVVAGGDKPRFEISPDGTRIRARYGHSIDVDPGDAPRRPPDVLYHGTARRSVDAILEEGISPMGRRRVHLSPDVVTARQVGARHGQPVVLTIDAAEMFREGATFHSPAQGTWLVDRVPPDRILGPAED